MEETNTTFKRNNPQYFTSPTPGQTTTDSAQMARNRADLIAGSGGNLREENGKVVPIASVSSNGGVKAINDELVSHKTDIAATTPETDVAPTEPEKPTAKKNPAMELIGGITPEEAQATGVNKDDYTYDTNTGYFIPKANTAGKEVNAANEQYDNGKKEIEDTFGTLSGFFDTSTQNLINSYKNLYSERVAEEKKVTETAVRMANTLNMRTGISRYAPGQAQSILTNVERQGLDRIRKIGIEEVGLIAKAEQALVEKKYDIFMKQRDEVKELRKERNKKVDELQKEAAKKLEERKKQVIQASRDAVIADLVNQGITDESEMIAILNEGGGDFTATEIEKAMKIFKPDDALKNLSADYRTYSYLQKIKDPAVEGLTYFEYEAAIANAKRAPEKPTEGEKRNNEYQSALQFKKDNPSASRKEVEQEIRSRTSLTDADINSIVGKEEDETKLTRESVSTLYGLPDDEDKTGFLGFGKTNKEKLDEIMETVERYKAVGYTDKEILKLIKE